VFFVIGAAVILFLSNLKVSDEPEVATKDRSRNAIYHCWEGYEKKSLDDGSKRFVAGTCEKMTDDFVARYGVRP
jgi:hypothetical protein